MALTDDFDGSNLPGNYRLDEGSDMSDKGDYSCPHGDRWIKWFNEDHYEWMHVIARHPTCGCKPPGLTNKKLDVPKECEDCTKQFDCKKKQTFKKECEDKVTFRPGSHYVKLHEGQRQLFPKVG